MNQGAQKAEVTLFQTLGGEPAIEALVERFYDLMDLEPGYAALRATHGSTLDDARQKLFWYLCGWLGGPSYYTERLGHPRLRMRHFPFAIGTIERDQWVACMDQAMNELQVDAQVRAVLHERFWGLADWMRNQAG